jgi:hypothetical protein
MRLTSREEKPNNFRNQAPQLLDYARSRVTSAVLPARTSLCNDRTCNAERHCCDSEQATIRFQRRCAVRVRKLDSLALALAVCGIVAACSSNGSPTTPSHTGLSGGATIVGHVSGFSNSANSQRQFTGSSSVGTANGLTSAANASTTLTVTVNGTNITSNVDGNGNFQLTGVPPGTVTLMFSGAGANASITLNNVPANAQISITVTLNGNSAKLETRDDEDENDGNDAGELDGIVSNKSGNCPTLTFTVQGSTVTTDGNTKFEDGQCSQIANGTKVDVDGTRQSNNSVLAKKVEID